MMMAWALWLAWLLAGGGHLPVSKPDAAREPTACVASCIQRDQMEAVGPEVIEADCRAECSSGSTLQP